MFSTERARSQWEYVRAFARAHVGETVYAPKHAIAHPRDAGAYASIGLPAGQDADFRFPPDHNCRGLHVQSIDANWAIHIDQVHPACGVAEHVRRDAPGAWIASGAALGGALGLLFSRKAEGALAGAFLGAMLAAVTVQSGAERPLS